MSWKGRFEERGILSLGKDDRNDTKFSRRKHLPYDDDIPSV